MDHWKFDRGPTLDEIRIGKHSAHGGIYCAKCRQFVQIQTGICSICGQKLTRKPLWKTVLLSILLIFLLLVLLSIGRFVIETMM